MPGAVRGFPGRGRAGRGYDGADTAANYDEDAVGAPPPRGCRYKPGTLRPSPAGDPPYGQYCVAAPARARQMAGGRHSYAAPAAADTPPDRRSARYVPDRPPASPGARYPAPRQ